MSQLFGTLDRDNPIALKLKESEIEDEIASKEEEKKKLNTELKKLLLEETDVKRSGKDGKEGKGYDGRINAINKKKADLDTKIKALDKEIAGLRKKKGDISIEEEAKTAQEIALDDRRANLTKRIKEIEENVEKQLLKKKSVEIEVLEKKMKKMEKLQKQTEVKERELIEAKKKVEVEDDDDDDLDPMGSRLVKDPSGTLVRRRQLEQQEMERMEKKKKEMEDRMRELSDGIEKTQMERRQALMRRKQKELEAMEQKMKRMTELVTKEKQDADKDIEINDDDDDFLKPPPGLISAVEKIDVVVSKLEKLDKLDELLKKVDSLSGRIITGVSFSGGGGGVESSGRTAEELKAELARLQEIIVDDKRDEKEREDANIKFEKTFKELEQTEEYKREMAAIAEEKRRINDPLNKKALEKMLDRFSDKAITGSTEIQERVKEHPELALIGMDPRAILSKHQNDFQVYLLRGLETDELRAIMASLPKFRGDQKRQIDWVAVLEAKIEHQAKEDADPTKQKPAPPPKKKLLPPKPGGKKAPPKKAPVGDVFAELLARKRQVE